jgi:O-antigen/teichoic acid export membrane protein
MPSIFSHIPGYLLSDLRMGVLVLAASSALQLPISTFTGVLVGLHRNEYPALAIGGSRIIGAAAVILASHATSSLLWLAVCIAVPNVIGGLVQVGISLRLLPQARVAISSVSRKMAIELARYCSVLTLFSLWMLLITGLDVTIVSYFQFSAVGYYSIASTAVTFFSGFNTAVFNAFISPVAVLHARSEYPRIAGLIMRATRLNTAANLTFVASAFAFGKPLLTAWIGQSYAKDVLPILLILLAGQAIRLVASAYASSLLAMGEQKYAVLPGAVEALSNVVFSLIGIRMLGPIGVAWGTLAGAVLGLCCYLGYTFRRVGVLNLKARNYVWTGVLVPSVTFLPLLVCTILLSRTAGQRSVLFWIVSLAVSIALFWKFESSRAGLLKLAAQLD